MLQVKRVLEGRILSSAHCWRWGQQVGGTVVVKATNPFFLSWASSNFHSCWECQDFLFFLEIERLYKSLRPLPSRRQNRTLCLGLITYPPQEDMISSLPLSLTHARTHARTHAHTHARTHTSRKKIQKRSRKQSDSPDDGRPVHTYYNHPMGGVVRVRPWHWHVWCSSLKGIMQTLDLS